MPTIWGIRDGYTLRPYQKFMEDLEGVPEGVRLRITIEKDRNGRFSALVHLMLGKLAKAVNRGPATTDIDKLKRWIKLRHGWYDVVPLPQPTPDGTTHAIDYHSVAFDKMGEDEFHRFARDACDLIRTELAPWVAGSPEWDEIAGIIASILPEPENAAQRGAQ